MVLKMDHHCAFTNNCIGLANHHCFVSFLFWAAAADAYVCAASLYVLSLPPPEVYIYTHIYIYIYSGLTLTQVEYPISGSSR